MKTRATKTGCALGAVLLLTTGCGQAMAGTALPNGDDAAAYVGAKFRTTMDKLETDITGARDISSSLDAYMKVDDKYIHSQITSSRAGSPESRIFRNHSLKNPDDARDYYTPADGTVEYTYLGPAYKSLEPTSWISTPKPAGGLINDCAWGGTYTPCNMARAVDQATKNDSKAVKGAKSTSDGRTELTVDVTFALFLSNRVESLPPQIVDSLSDGLKKAQIPTTITVNPDGTLQEFVMDAKFGAQDHKIELRYDFKYTGKATLQDMPKLPDASQITVLDQAGADDFERRLGDFQAGGH